MSSGRPQRHGAEGLCYNLSADRPGLMRGAFPGQDKSKEGMQMHAV